MVRSPNEDRRPRISQESPDVEDHIDITMYGLPLYPPSVASSGPSSPSRNQYQVYSTPLLGQMYRRAGPAHQQRTTWFGGQYCTTYGLDDPLPAFQENDPFAWQVEGIETARATFGVQHHSQAQTQAQMKVEFQAEMRRQQLERQKKACTQAQLRSRLLGRGETHGMMSQGEDFMAARFYFERETGYTQDDHHKDDDEVDEMRVPPSTPEWVLAQPTQISALSDLRAMMDGASAVDETAGTSAITSASNVVTEIPSVEVASSATPSTGNNINRTTSDGRFARGTFTLPGHPSASSRPMPIRTLFKDNTFDGHSSDGSSPVRNPVGDPARSPDGSLSAKSGTSSDGTSPDRSVPRTIGSGMAHQLQTYLQRRDPEIVIASNNHASEAAADSKPEADSEPRTDAKSSTPETKATAMTAQEFFWEEMRAYTRGEGPRDPREPLLPFIYLGSPQEYQEYKYVSVKPGRAEDEDSEDSYEDDSDGVVH